MIIEHIIITVLLSLLTLIAGLKFGGRDSDKYLLKADNTAACAACKTEQQRESNEAFEQIKSLRNEMQGVNKTLASIEGGLRAKGII